MVQKQSDLSVVNAKPTILAKVTAGGLVVSAVAIWIQWLSGDPAYPKVPPGPIIFVIIAGVIVAGARWWWMPILGALVSVMTTLGWFVRLQAEMLRLSHPGTIGRFAAGIFLGTLLQILALLVTDVGGFAATVQNYRRLNREKVGAKTVCQILGVLFVLMGSIMMFSSTVDKYHNLLHLVWGAAAMYLGIAASAVAAKRFCIVSGAFYLALGALGKLAGDVSMNGAWHAGPMLLHTADHVFHLVLGTALLATGLISGRQWIQHSVPAGSK